ncbi:response regulator [Fibrella sp. HMF5036]|uniref:Response regulator n=2 Tax=Fibrella aquatilis TaxID=2817059 RepID=A0A939G7B3_9BACT|nr:response regulator [Fibrella aquatilis]
MNQIHKPLLLIADDDDDDRVLIEQALKQTAFNGQIRFVEDGEQLIQYLKDCQSDSPDAPQRPTLLLVDLNMPVVNGIEALTYIKSVPGLRQLPVVMLTTSSAETDISTCYNLGASSFVIKPITFTKLVELMDSLRTYWLGTVQLPR